MGMPLSWSLTRPSIRQHANSRPCNLTREGCVFGLESMLEVTHNCSPLSLGTSWDLHYQTRLRPWPALGKP